MPNFGPTELIVVLFIVMCGVITSRVGASKGYDKTLFFVLGVIFQVVAVLAVLVLPRRSTVTGG